MKDAFANHEEKYTFHNAMSAFHHLSALASIIKDQHWMIYDHLRGGCSASEKKVHRLIDY